MWLNRKRYQELLAYEKAKAAMVSASREPVSKEALKEVNKRLEKNLAAYCVDSLARSVIKEDVSREFVNGFLSAMMVRANAGTFETKDFEVGLK